MKLNAPSGVTQVFADDGEIIPVVNGQVDVEPHLVAGLQGQGFTIASTDALTSDAAQPAAVADTVQPE